MEQVARTGVVSAGGVDCGVPAGGRDRPFQGTAFRVIWRWCGAIRFLGISVHMGWGLSLVVFTTISHMYI